MIKDPDTLTRLRAEWAGVTKMIERMKMLLAGTFAGGAFTAPALGGIVYNLPLLLAFDVLAQTLRALRDQNEFKCRSDSLGRLLEAGKGTVSWVDWQAIRTGVDLRNAVAHDGVLHNAKICWNAISAVETELLSWGVVVRSNTPLQPTSGGQVGVE